MKRFLPLLAFCAGCLLLTTPRAWGDTVVRTVQPFTGIGYANSDRPWGDGFGAHLGVRLMLSANDRQRWGFEISHLDLYALDDGGPDIRYHSVGMLVEQTLRNWFLMSIGTVGYIGAGDNDDKPFGIRAGLGWDRNNLDGFSPFVVFRTDVIFDDPRTRINSLSAGVRVRF